MIASYIDSIELKKENDKLEIVNGNFRKDYLLNLLNNNAEYGLPYNMAWFKDDYGFHLNMNKELKTKEEALKYFKKLQATMGSEYKLNYYEVDTDDDLNNNRYKKQNLKLGVITIDLSNILDKNGNQVYKSFFEKAKEVFENELCNI